MPIISPIALSAASKGRGGISMSAGEIAIRAGNTVAWYDYLDASTITNDGSNLISKWTDKLGSGHDLSAATTARPTLTADGILFNGTGNYMKTSNFTFNQPMMLYIVARAKTWTNLDTIVSGTTNDCMLLRQIDSSPQIEAVSTTASSNNSDWVLNTWGIIRVLFNGASSKLIVNENTAVTGNFGTSGAGGIVLGSVANTSSRWGNIEFKGLVFRNKADTATDESNIYNYLKTLYSL